MSVPSTPGARSPPSAASCARGRVPLLTQAAIASTACRPRVVVSHRHLSGQLRSLLRIASFACARVPSRMVANPIPRSAGCQAVEASDPVAIPPASLKSARPGFCAGATERRGAAVTVVELDEIPRRARTRGQTATLCMARPRVRERVGVGLAVDDVAGRGLEVAKLGERLDPELNSLPAEQAPAEDDRAPGTAPHRVSMCPEPAAGALEGVTAIEGKCHPKPCERALSPSRSQEGRRGQANCPVLR